MSGSTGLAVTDIVEVDVSITQLAAQQRNFGLPLICGPSDVINTSERFRPYTSLAAVATDFGTTAPEYLAAAAFFGQSPQPAQCYIGRWAKTATSGILVGGPFNTAQQAALLTTLQGISTGSMDISIDGTQKTLSALNFSAILNLAAAAAVIATALAGAATCTWNSVYGYFQIESSTTGASSSVSYASPEGSGVDVSADLQLTAATGAQAPVPGIVAETPVECATVMATISNAWYMLGFAPAAAGDITDSEYQAVAAFIEASSPARVFGYTTQEAAALTSTDTTSLPYVLAGLKYNRTMGQYSSYSLYAHFSMFGRLATVNYDAANSTITMMFKQEPGITAENLQESQAQALKAKNCNVYVAYSNSTVLLQWGTMASGQYIDVIVGADWLANSVQTNVFNALYTAPTKIPQTDPGVHILVTAAEQSMVASVNNGYVAPGVWNSTGFGALQQGQVLAKGYYIYQPSVASQTEAQRETRAAPVMQIAAKLAGAIHSANVQLNINP